MASARGRQRKTEVFLNTRHSPYGIDIGWRQARIPPEYKKKEKKRKHCVIFQPQWPLPCFPPSIRVPAVAIPRMLVYTNAYPQCKAESGTTTPFFCPQPVSDYHAKAGSKFDGFQSVFLAAEGPDISVGLFACRFRQVGLSNIINNRRL